MRPKIKDSTILVVGGAGFIGSHLVDRLYDEKAAKVIIIDNMFLGNEDNLSNAFIKDAILYKDDAEIFSSLQYIFERYKIDVVFNCATKALNYSFVNPKNAFDTNVQVVLNLLELQRKKAFTTLVHFSTSEVYGTAMYEPMDEKHPVHPTTTYAAGKAAADIALESYVRMFNLDSFIVRPFNNYGPRQNYSGYLAGVIPLTIWKIFKGDKPVIHGSGLQSRDFIYVFDTIDATIKTYDKLKAGDSINLATDGQLSIKEVIELIFKHMNYNGDVEYEENRQSDVVCHNACNKKIKSLIEFKLTPFKVGLEETIDWYVDLFKKDTP